MNQSNPFVQIETTLQTLYSITNKIKGSPAFQKIDIDLLLQKTRELYEHILNLEVAPLPPVENPEAFQNQKSQPTSTVSIPKPKIAREEENNPKATITFSASPTGTVTIETQKDEANNKQSGHSEIEETLVPPHKTTLDLFSAAMDDSLGEALSHQTQPDVGEKLKNSHIKDLREAIGINDKFQFINELFNGDLGQYNKVLDELNNFSNLQGSLTYLSELSVQYNFHKSGTAFQRLKALLEKKYA